MKKYQTFWKRLLAGLIDGFLFVPFVIFGSDVKFINGEIPTICWLLFINLLPVIYNVWCHWQYGQTIGKRVAGIQVISVDEIHLLGLRQAFYRDVIWVILNFLTAFFLIFKTLTDLTYTAAQLSIISDAVLTGISIIWALLELITMMLNPKRRAIHDFMAGSVVIDLTQDAIMENKPA